MNKFVVESAVTATGSNAALAAALGVHESAISLWKTGRRKVPAKYCIAVELATGGKVTRYDLRPDVFGADQRAIHQSRREEVTARGGVGSANKRHG